MFRALAVALAAQGAAGLNVAPVMAPHAPSVTVTPRAAVLMESNKGYKRASYLDRLKGPSNKMKGRAHAQALREAKAKSEAEAAARAEAKAAAEAAAEAAAAEAEEAPAEEEPVPA